MQDPDKPPPSVWMLSLRHHTYHGVKQPEGTFYQAHEYAVETLENLKFAVRDKRPPPILRRSA